MNIRPIAIGILAVMIVVLVGWALMRGRQSPRQQQGQQQQVQTTPVIVASHDIAQGQQLTNDDVITKPMTDEELKALPTDVLMTADGVLGGLAAYAISGQGFFTSGNVIPAPAGVSEKVETGYLAVTIAAPDAPSLYDLKFIDPDDRVDVFGVQADQTGLQTNSVRLATNVRLLAVDTVYDKFKEQQRREKLQQEIQKLKNERESYLKTTPPPQPEAVKQRYDDPIAELAKQIDPVIEHPSVTLEVTYAQSQKIALWQKTASIQIALHRRPDADTAIFDAGLASLPTTVGGQPAPEIAAVLTLDDVVPLQDRDSQAYAQKVRAENDLREMTRRQDVQDLEDQVHRAELKVELANLQRYGTRVAQPQLARAAQPPAVSAQTQQQISELGRKVDQLASAVQQIRQQPAPQAAAQPGTTVRGGGAFASSIEIIRGNEKSVMEYQP